jgi:penicillin G amidase
MLRVLRGLFFLVIILFLLGVAGLIYLRLSLPKTNGTLSLPGLKNTVEILRDRNAVPHIYATSKDDAYFALGFVHAQDRLWQMEFQRRIGAGRLAEVVGEAALDTDTFLRTLSVYHYAEAALPKLSEETRSTLESYVLGINTYLQTRKGPLPPEFLILGHTPEPWTATDILVWAKMMAWDLSGNWDDELLRVRLSKVLSLQQIAELYPPYPGEAPVILPDFKVLYQDLPLDHVWALSPKPEPPGAGSNNWVLSGNKTATGQPMLANDPHLGLGAPSLWYFAHLSAPGLEVIGATLPGTPAVLLGRNDKVAWGFTNTGPDVQDLFIEQINQENPSQYLTPQGYQDFTIRQEVIKVKDAQDVNLQVRESRHGPIISDASKDSAEAANLSGENHVLAFAWTALQDDDLTMQAVINLNTVQSWSEFTEVLKDFSVPQQNIVYADTEGNIGYYAPAKVPIRAKGDGFMPSPGWTGEYDWTGYIPFDDLPHDYNPASGQIVTANHKVVPDDYPYFIGRDWAEPYRAERITNLLEAMDQHTLDSLASIQIDQLSLMSQDFTGLLRSVKAETTLEKTAQAEILSWDGKMERSKAAPLIFAAWYRELSNLVYNDEMGPFFEDYYGFHPMFMHDVISGKTAASWCDDISSSGQESCDFIANQAFKQAILYLSEHYGADIGKWEWGKAHYAHSDHAILTDTPLGRIFDIKIPNGGDAFSVNAARFDMADEAEPFRQTNGPGYRALYDLSNLSASRFIHTTGQSGNPLSSHYRDFAEIWRDGRYISMTTTRAEIEKGRIGTLNLLPIP